MDDQLRNRLWNVFRNYFVDPMTNNERYIPKDNYYDPVYRFFKAIWDEFFKVSLNSLSDSPELAFDVISEFFLKKANWHEAYDFIEFVAGLDDELDIPSYINQQFFIEECNEVLEAELSAYRLVGGKIVEITDEREIKEIEDAIEKAKRLKLEGVKTHLDSAAEKLAVKKNPDFRNSIKESISSVESLCQKITGNPNASLGDALDAIEKEGEVELHPALKQAYSKIYGYSSNADGIRHAISKESSCDFADAKYMLVSCSAFINYLIEKATKAGIKL